MRLRYWQFRIELQILNIAFWNGIPRYGNPIILTFAAQPFPEQGMEKNWNFSNLMDFFFASKKRPSSEAIIIPASERALLPVSQASQP